jgi:hypothetical protein
VHLDPLIVAIPAIVFVGLVVFTRRWRPGLFWLAVIAAVLVVLGYLHP